MSISDLPPKLNDILDNKNLFDFGFIHGSPNAWVQFIILEFQGPESLAPAVGWLTTLTFGLASLTFCLASLNLLSRFAHLLSRFAQPWHIKVNASKSHKLRTGTSHNLSN